jgi:hypothetical protein
MVVVAAAAFALLPAAASARASAQSGFGTVQIPL